MSGFTPSRDPQNDRCADAQERSPRADLGYRFDTPFMAFARRWLDQQTKRRTADRCGGDQKCPWCKRWLNQLGAASWADAGDGFMDELTCAVCGGKSLWKWEWGFCFVGVSGSPTTPVGDFDEFGTRQVAELLARRASSDGAQRQDGPVNDPGMNPKSEVKP